jgi:thiol-disulfide isomerase/thioredoxin
MPKIIIGIVALLIAVGGTTALIQNNKSKDAMMQKEMMMKDEAMKAADADAMMKKDEMMKKEEMMKSDSMMKKDDAMMKKDEMMKKDAGMMKKDEMKKDSMMMKKGTYETYSAEKLSMAMDSGKVILFFHASWCPVCRGLEGEINAGAAIPENVHILKVDFDTAQELRKKYGVTVQHTFVQVDAKGTLLQKFSDATQVSQVFAKVK